MHLRFLIVFFFFFYQDIDLISGKCDIFVDAIFFFFLTNELATEK